LKTSTSCIAKISLTIISTTKTTINYSNSILTNILTTTLKTSTSATPITSLTIISTTTKA
jgi:hypothetical protein